MVSTTTDKNSKDYKEENTDEPQIFTTNIDVNAEGIDNVGFSAFGDLVDDGFNNDNVISTNASNDISIFKMFCYGLGHFYNDLCASMWFTYLMIFLEKVLNFRSSLAGSLFLIGQVADAISTPVVGIASDNSWMPFCLGRFGRRISWHILGTVLVTFSFPFLFNSCFLCRTLKWDWVEFAWYVPFIVIFQFGWASVQISHLALIPELSENNSSRTTMNSLRYGATVLASLFVFGLLTFLLNSSDSGTSVEPSDLLHFSVASISVVVLGSVITIIFYLTTREPQIFRRRSRYDSISSEASIFIRMSWTNWLRHSQFYQIGLLYTFSRLYINISQVYFPFYIVDTQMFSKKFVAILPMISFVSSFFVSLIISVPFINRNLNRKILCFVGGLVGLGNCVGMHFNLHNAYIYLVAVMLGISQAILLVTSLAITADLINKNTESGAFVYGAMSFADKMANGIALQIIELFNPQLKNDPDKCAQFYRTLMSFVPGGCLVLTLIILAALMPQKIGRRRRRRDDDGQPILVSGDGVDEEPNQ